MPPPRRRGNTTKFAVGFLAGLVIVGLMNLNLIGEVRNQSSDSGGPGWTRILGGSIGRVAAGSVVLVHPDRSRDVTVYRQAAHEICARALHCHVVFWIDERPMNESKGHDNAAADYVYNATNNFEQYRWDCRIFNRKWEDCLPQSTDSGSMPGRGWRQAKANTYTAVFPAQSRKEAAVALSNLQKLQTSLFTASRATLVNEEGVSGTWHVIRVGPFNDHASATKLCSEVRDEVCLVMIQ